MTEKQGVRAYLMAVLSPNPAEFSASDLLPDSLIGSRTFMAHFSSAHQSKVKVRVSMSLPPLSCFTHIFPPRPLLGHCANRVAKVKFEVECLPTITSKFCA